MLIKFSSVKKNVPQDGIAKIAFIDQNCRQLAAVLLVECNGDKFMAL